MFTDPVSSNGPYKVTVATQPANPPQTCVVSSSGRITDASVATVQVSCTTNTYSVGAYVSGLTGSGLTLTYNNGTPQVIARNGFFAAATGVAIGTPYRVAIASQPASQTCVLSNAKGTVAGANVTSISVFCPQPVGRRA